MQVRICSAVTAVAILTGAFVCPAVADERVKKDDKGRIVAVPLPIDEEFLNPWPAEMEDGFRTRADHAIRAHKGKISGNTYFENEKSLYPTAILAFLYGRRDAALKTLQEEDNQAGSWNKRTLGIDWYPSFTIKSQVRKYFFFGEYLDPKYRKRMYNSAKIWTEKDPHRRPNPFTEAHKNKLRSRGKKPSFSWTPEFMNSWVDVRNTDNLRAMRECAVYLMAEETGNKETAAKMKAHIRRYVWALWNIGMGEWDSENYHAHTMTGYIQLYDFAKDPEVKMMAKAAMDMLSLMGAVKYYEGGFCGPIKRDYNKPYAFAGAAGELSLYFDDTPIANPDPHRDHAHFVTSAYRPPVAIVKLAHKEFGETVELWASKPTYENWKAEGKGASAGPDYPAEKFWEGKHSPEFFETTTIGRTYQLGSLAKGSRGDVNGLKMCMTNSKRGADFFVAAGATKPGKGINRGAGVDRIGQYENLLVCLSSRGKTNYAFMVPDHAKLTQADGVTFVQTEKTWLAIRPVGGRIDTETSDAPKNWNARFFTGKCSGFVMEVGDREHFKGFEEFRTRVIEKSQLEHDGKSARLVGSRGKTLKVEISGGGLPDVYRDGKQHDWKKHWALYQSTDGKKAPLHLGWKTGKLYVQAGGWTFEASFDHTGKYEFKNRKLD